MVGWILLKDVSSITEMRHPLQVIGKDIIQTAEEEKHQLGQPVVARCDSPGKTQVIVRLKVFVVRYSGKNTQAAE